MEALRYCLKSIEIKEQVGCDKLDLAVTKHKAGKLFLFFDQYNQAIFALREACDLYNEACGGDDPRAEECFTNLGNATGSFSD